MFNHFSDNKPRPKRIEPEIKDLTKDELKGKRKQKRKDKDYEKKYGDLKETNWN